MDGEPRKKAIFRAYQVIWYLLGVLEVLLLFRFGFKLFAANPRSEMVSWVYSVTNPLISPFVGIFPTPAFSGAVFEPSTLLATAVYAVVALGIVYLLQLIKPVDPTEIDRAVNNP